MLFVNQKQLLPRDVFVVSIALIYLIVLNSYVNIFTSALALRLFSNRFEIKQKLSECLL